MTAPLTESFQPAEEELVERARGGDAEAFRDLFNRSFAMIHAFSYRACLNEAVADDLAQETFIKAARSLHTLAAGASFKAWLYRIAANTFRDWLREKARQGRIANAVAERAAGDEAAREPDHSKVAEALRALPDDLRLAVVLTFYEGMNHAEAARALGCAETTVSWRVFRAKRKLKAVLSRKENA